MTYKDAHGREFWVESVGSGQWKIMSSSDELETVKNCKTEIDAANQWIEYSRLRIYG